jgi:predicted RNA methylase
MAGDTRARAVARVAVDIAAAGDVALPEALRLWRLAGGRPAVGTLRPGCPDDLGAVLEAALDVDARRRRGAHFTPPPVADELVATALGGMQATRVLDPACGGGAFLLAAARHLAARGMPRQRAVRCLWGVDIDPVAVATAEAALTIWAGCSPAAEQLVVADPLLDELGWPPFDAVVGNPPFLSQLARATTRDALVVGDVLRARFGDAVQPYTDTASLFLLLACRLTRAGGRVVLIQPQSVLASRDAAAVRAAIGAMGVLRDVWFPDGAVFGAAVDVCAPVIDVGAATAAASPPSTARAWASHLASALDVPDVDLEAHGLLGDMGAVVAGFRDEYYGIAPHVRERADWPDGAPLVTTGLVDLGACAWGARPARVAKRRWSAPVVDVGAVEGKAAMWIERTRRPKVVVATQTKVMEAAVDETGDWVPGVPLVVVLAQPSDLWHVAAAVCAPPVTAWVAHRTAGTALTQRALKVSAKLVAQIPLPADRAAWDVGARALRDGDIDTFATAMTAAYGADEAVRTWWHTRR